MIVVRRSVYQEHIDTWIVATTCLVRLGGGNQVNIGYLKLHIIYCRTRNIRIEYNGIYIFLE